MTEGDVRSVHSHSWPVSLCACSTGTIVTPVWLHRSKVNFQLTHVTLIQQPFVVQLLHENHEGTYFDQYSTVLVYT